MPAVARAKHLTSAITTYRIIQLAVLVVLATAFVTSFASGSSGAGLLGYNPHYTVSLPLVCDVVAGAATVIHGRVRRDREMRRLAAWFVLVPMMLSWAANAIDHANRAAAEAGSWTPHQRLAWIAGVVFFAGICPMAVAGLLHLSTKYAEFEQRSLPKRPKVTPATPAVDPAPRTPKPAPQPKPVRDEVQKARTTSDVRVAWLRDHVTVWEAEHGRKITTGEKIAAAKAQFGVSTSTAERDVSKAKAS